MQEGGTAWLRGPFLLALAAAFLGTAAYRLSLPAVAFFARSVLGSSMVELGFFTTAFFAARPALSPLSALRPVRTAVMALAAAICFLAHAGVVASYVLATSWLHVILLRALQGALNGVAWTAIQIAVGAKALHAVRGRAFSIYFFLGSLGAFAGSALYSCLAGSPLEHAVLLSAAFLVLTALLAVRLGRVSPAGGRGGGSSSAAPARRAGRVGGRGDALLIASISSISLCSRALSSLLVSDVIYVYLSEGLGLSPGAASLLVGLGSLLGMGASTGITWLADRRSDKLALAVATALLVAGSLTFSFEDARLAIPGFLLLALGVLGLLPLTRSMAMACRQRGLAMGLENAVGNVGTAISSPVLGSLLEGLGGQVVIGPLALVPALLITGTVLALGTLLSAVAAARSLSRPAGAPRP